MTTTDTAADTAADTAGTAAAADGPAPDTAPKIADELRQHLVPIDTLKPWPGNPRVGDLDAMAESLAENGQYRLAVVQKATGQICAGNHMWRAAKELLGWTHIGAVFLDLDDHQARKLLAADNRVSDLGSYNDYLLTDLLREISAVDDMLAGTGYTDDDLDALLRTTDALGTTSSEFLDTFIAPPQADDPFAPPAPRPPVTDPFTNQPPEPHPGPPAAHPPAPFAAPGPTTTVTTTTHVPGAPGHPPAPYQPPHTGPEPYTGPGAPAAPQAGAELPTREPLATVSWVVNEAQRATVRAAVNHARTTGNLDTGAEALVTVCARYLAHTGADAAADAAADTGPDDTPAADAPEETP